jgi:hypothetical protein
MANIPGDTNALPGVTTSVVTQSSGVSIPTGALIPAIIGEGSTNEIIVSQALGGGKDGLNATYTSTTGSDGRHFQLQNFPLISNRTTLYKNGIPLVGLESLITPTSVFSYNYDYLINITNGQILLQAAHLEDQGGAFFLPLPSNVGVGILNNLTLVDDDAPPETWTIRCVGVQRNPMNQPIAGTASFIAIGSVSGALLDANGNPIVWIANDEVVSNGVLSFAVEETDNSPFVQGDAFTVIVASGVLVLNDSLTSTEIPVNNLNSPALLQGLGAIYNQFGPPLLGVNCLSIGAQLAFANNCSNALCVQAAPPLPRRTSYILDTSVNATALDNDEFIFPLPLGVVPDLNSDIHFFVQNNTTLVETQILPNKFQYYLLDTEGQPSETEFIFSNANPPGGYSFSYTVMQSLEAVSYAQDGYIGRNLAFNNQGVFSSASVEFNSSYIGQVLQIIDTVNSANYGLFDITAVNDGNLYVVANGVEVAPELNTNPPYLSDFINETGTGFGFEIINPVTGLPVPGGSATDGTIVTAGQGTGEATLTSLSINFAAFAGIDGYRIQINGSTVGTAAEPVGNDGLYDIVSASTNEVTIQKALVNESGMRWEVLDPTAVSSYIVVNHNVVPNGNQLRVTIVDARDADFYDAGWLNALESLTTQQCDIVVPLPLQTISIIFQNALSHCLTMSNLVNKKERVLFTGAINGLTPDNLAGITLAAVEDLGPLEGIPDNDITSVLAANLQDIANYSVADAFGNTYRCVYFYPDQIVVVVGGDFVMLDGFYIAAAAAGWESANAQIQNPLTNKTITGFTILGNKVFNVQTLQLLAASGVTTLQPVAGGGNVVWGITTSQSGFVEEQEISIIFIRDRVAKTLRAGFQGFIGTASGPNTAAVLNTRGVILLNSLVSQGIITAYANLSVTQDPVDPTQWDITVLVQPTYPVNFIYITVEIGQLSA